MTRSGPGGCHCLLTFIGATIACAVPAVTLAQHGDSSWIDKLRGFHDGLRQQGVAPDVGTVVPGSGLAVGADVLIPHLGPVPLGADVEGKISVRGYRELVVRVGRVANRRHASDMHPADAELSSLFSDGRKNVSGLDLYLERRDRRLPSLTVFGTGTTGQLTRADFGRSGSTTDAVLHWQRSTSVGVSARVGALAMDLFPGTSDTQENIDVAFEGFTAARQPVPRVRYMMGAVGISVDHRDAPGAATKGYRVDGLVRRYVSQTTGQASMTRVSLDARGFHSPTPRHVLAARVLASVTAGAGDQGVPFYLMESLGGGHTLRSFHPYRLRGARLIALSTESRWRAARMVEVAPFIDAGFVRGAPLPGTPRGLLLSPGLGFRVRTAARVVVRADLAFGREGGRVAFAVNAPF